MAKKSHRLGYSVPKIATEQSAPGDCKTTTVTLQHTPVECIKRGLPVEEALQMKPLDLNKADGLYLLENGLSKQCIKRLYGFKSDATLYVRLKVLGLHPWPPEEQEIPKTDVAPEPPWKPIMPEVPEKVKAIVSDAIAEPDIPCVIIDEYHDHVEPALIPCEPETDTNETQELAKQVADSFSVPYSVMDKLMAEPVPEFLTSHPFSTDNLKHAAETLNKHLPETPLVADPDKIAEFLAEEVPEPEDIAGLTKPASVVINTIDTKGFKAFLKNDTPAIPEPPADEFQWFHREQKNKHESIITVRANGDIYFSTEFGKLFTVGAMVEIGLTPDCNKIAIKNGGTYRLTQCDKTNTSKAISAGNIRDELSWKEILFPARYRMERSGDIWVGVLL